MIVFISSHNSDDYVSIFAHYKNNCQSYKG